MTSDRFAYSAILVLASALVVVSPSPTWAAMPGDVLITEIMKDPFKVDDINGEWFELYNTTNAPIDLDGWTIEDADGNIHTVTNYSPLIIPAHRYLVFGINGQEESNGGVVVHYTYDVQFRLNNGADGIILYDTTLQEIDRVMYDGGVAFPDPKGASLQLTGNYKVQDQFYNDLGSNWGVSTSPYGLGDLGTPGADNDGFVPGADADPPVLVRVELITRSLLQLWFSEAVSRSSAEEPSHYSGVSVVDATREAAGDSVLLGLASPLVSGISYNLAVQGVQDLSGNAMPLQQTGLSFLTPQVVISEIMYDSRRFNGIDVEWVELYAPASNPASISLQGWYLTDDEIGPPGDGSEGVYRFPPGTVIQPGQYLVASASTEAMHGIGGAVLLEVSSPGSLNNTGDELSLWDGGDASARLIDGSLTDPYPDLAEAGRSLERVDILAPWSKHPLAWRECGVVSGASPEIYKYASPGRANGTSLPDLDGDRIPNVYERFEPLGGGTNSHLADSDGDGLSDWTEDDDLDLRTSPGETDARRYDTDGDGVPDGVERRVLGSDPLNPGSPLIPLDQDRDGLPTSHDPNDLNPDADGDRYSDGYEAAVLGLGAVNRADAFPYLADVNMDRFVTSLDALAIQTLFLHLIEGDHPVFGGRGTSYSDVNRDGFITSLDALIVHAFFLYLTPRLPL